MFSINRSFIMPQVLQQLIISDDKTVLLALVGGIAAFAIALVFISDGAIKQVATQFADKKFMVGFYDLFYATWQSQGKSVLLH